MSMKKQVTTFAIVVIFLTFIAIVPAAGYSGGSKLTSDPGLSMEMHKKSKFASKPSKKDLFPPIPTEKSCMKKCGNYYSKKSCDYICTGKKADGKKHDTGISVYDRCVKSNHKKSTCQKIAP